MSNTPTILLVEDEAIIAMAERVTIERYGYRVIIARSGEKAVDALAERPEIDLVLMDIDLGCGMSGPDTAKAILADRELPVVFLSSHTERSVVEQTEGITSYGYIVKNSGETVLIASIRMAFRLYHAIRARMESEARTRALLAANPDVMLVFDATATIIDHHAADGSSLLMSPERFLNRHVRDVVPTDLAETAEQSVARVLATGDPCVVEYDARDQAGRHQYYEGRFVRSGSDAVLMISRNVTAQREHEDRVRLLSEMLDAAPSSVVIHDLDGRFLFANQKTLQTFGYSRDEFLAMNIRDLKSPDSAAKVHERMELIRRTGSAVFEAENRRSDGSVFPMEVFAKLVTWGDTPAIMSISDDITERKKAEHELRLHALVLDQIQDLVTVTDLDGTVTYVNSAEASALGYDPTEIIGRSVDVYGDDGNHGATQQEIIRTTRDSGSWSGTVVNRDKSGVARTMYSRTQVVTDDDGTPIALCGISTDITESARVARALAQSEERYRAIFDHLPHGIAYYDANGVCIDCNDAMVQIAGVARSTLIGFDMNTLDDESLRSILRRALAGEDVQFEGPVRVHSVSEPKWIRSRSIPLYGVSGELHIVAIVEDLTESRRLQQELRLSQERLQIISQNVNDLVVILDLDGVVTYATDSHLPLGYPPDEIDGIDGFLLVHPDERDAARRMLTDAIRERTPMSGTYRLRRYDGTYRAFDCRGHIVLDAAGAPRHALFSARPVSGDP